MAARWRAWRWAASLASALFAGGCALPDHAATPIGPPPSQLAEAGDSGTNANESGVAASGAEAADQTSGDSAFAGHLKHGLLLVYEDEVNCWSLPHLAEFTTSLAAAGVLANTSADRKVASWYQESIRSRSSDDVSSVVKNFGEYTYTLPALAAVALAGKLAEETDLGSAGLEWGTRSLRAMIVGAPVVGILQVGLGADRPEANDSRWHPFRSEHGASGHAFVGAVPFLTAAAMTDEPLLKAVLVGGSLSAGWSRINDNAHYLSQVLLGWTVAFIAVDAVNDTVTGKYGLHVAPSLSSGGAGVAISLDY